jgi:hypothetical protein
LAWPSAGAPTLSTRGSPARTWVRSWTWRSACGAAAGYCCSSRC